MRKLIKIKAMAPTMEWGPRALYALWKRSIGDGHIGIEGIDFTRTGQFMTLFRQRWRAKGLVRTYHGPQITEKIFKRWYLPSFLPDVRPKRPVTHDAVVLERFAGREKKRREEEEERGMAPVASLMFTEVERRVDTVVFRACFAPSIWEARRLVLHGRVMLNGKKHKNPNTRLAPGDMISVDPKAIKMLQPPPVPKSRKIEEAAAKEQATGTHEADSQRTKAHGEALSKWSNIQNNPNASPTLPASEPLSPKTYFRLPPYSSPFIFVPAYLEVSFATCSAVFVRYPTARPGYSEIPTPYDADGEVIRLTWEWYQKRRIRVRSRRQKAQEPENRTEEMARTELARRGFKL